MLAWLVLCLSPWLAAVPGCESVAVVEQVLTPAQQLPQQTQVHARKTRVIPSQTHDQGGQPMTVAGMSGVAYLGKVTHDGDRTTWHRFAAVCDGKSGSLVFLDMTFADDGTIAQVEVAGGLRLEYQLDFEGIATPGAPQLAFQHAAFLSSEVGPGLFLYSLDTGKRLATIETPKIFTQRFKPAADGHGAVRKSIYPTRTNRGFESLARHPAGGTLWLANEEALVCDGPTADDQHGTPVRLVRFATAGGEATPVAQYIYNVDPIHSRKTPKALSGLSELLVTPDGKLLALERSAVESFNPLQHRLYEIDFAGATDVSDLAKDGLIGQSHTPVQKRLVWKTDWLTSPGNLEGLCMGPRLANGNWVIVGVVDNGDPLSGNVVLSFEYQSRPASHGEIAAAQ